MAFNKLKNLKKDIKLEFKTSQLNRIMNIRKVTKIIKSGKLKPEDTANIQKLESIIVYLDLDDDRFGKTIDPKIMEQFKAIKAENEKIREAEESKQLGKLIKRRVRKAPFLFIKKNRTCNTFCANINSTGV